MIPITPQKIKDCGDLGKHTCRVREEGSNSQTLSTSTSGSALTIPTSTRAIAITKRFN